MLPLVISLRFPSQEVQRSGESQDLHSDGHYSIVNFPS